MGADVAGKILEAELAGLYQVAYKADWVFENPIDQNVKESWRLFSIHLYTGRIMHKE